VACGRFVAHISRFEHMPCEVARQLEALIIEADFVDLAT
jgi:hypothetical protein